jgi:hypothetical protein
VGSACHDNHFAICSHLNNPKFSEPKNCNNGFPIAAPASPGKLELGEAVEVKA